MGEALRERLQAGDVEGAFELLHRELHADLDRFIASRLSSSTERADLAQEVWEAARHALPAFRFGASAKVWLLSIARRRLADLHRKGARADRHLDDLDTGLLSAALAQGDQTPSRQLHAAQKRRVLQDALATLEPEERELLELRFVNGLKPAEIVEVLGLTVPANTVSQRLVRLVKKMRSALESKSGLDSYR